MTTERWFAAVGAVSGFLAVAAGAFGAPALRARLSPPLIDVFETGARYQMYPALALLAVARRVEPPAAGRVAAGRRHRLPGSEHGTSPKGQRNQDQQQQRLFHAGNVLHPRQDLLLPQL